MRIKGYPISDWLKWYWYYAKGRMRRIIFRGQAILKTSKMKLFGGTCDMCREHKTVNEMANGVMCDDCLPF